MNQAVIAVIVAGCASLAGAQNSSPAPAPAGGTPSQTQTQSEQNHPRRAQARLAGFDLAPDKTSANQIGGASRTLATPSKLILDVPHKGRVYTVQPTFWWQGDPNATYKFHIQDVTGSSGWDRQVTGTSLAYPNDVPPLEPGKTYLWRVASDSPLLSPPPAAAMILVLTGPDRDQVQTAEAQIQGTGMDADVARAKVYFDQRLFYDALMAYSAMIAKYPGQPQLYQLRGALYDQLPATEALADADYARAH